ncbi:MAG: hypothetical protein NVS1B7_6350 [Candidatus Saccharimonadales bacterium]
MIYRPEFNMTRLREAIEVSWKADTSYLHVYEDNTPTMENCYHTALVTQYFFPNTEIVEGEVWTGKSTDKHFGIFLMYMALYIN